MANSIEIFCYLDRMSVFTIGLTQVDGSNFALDVSDVLRFKIGPADGSTPLLEFRSGAPTSNGSSLVVTARSPQGTADLTLAQADLLGIAPGAHSAEIAVVDGVASGHPIRHAQFLVLHVIGTPGGNVNLTS